MLKENAIRYYQDFRENNPDKIVKRGLDIILSEDKLMEAISLAEIIWWGEYISEEQALERALKVMSKNYKEIT